MDSLQNETHGASGVGLSKTSARKGEKFNQGVGQSGHRQGLKGGEKKGLGF